jgi:hypothetical protein
VKVTLTEAPEAGSLGKAASFCIGAGARTCVYVRNCCFSMMEMLRTLEAAVRTTETGVLDYFVGSADSKTEFEF